MIQDLQKFKKNKLLLYELNEVPLRVLKLYVKEKPHSSFAYLLNKGLMAKTFTFDEGELHPWSTWPTVHRGVSNKKHNIKFINQDLNCAKEFKPIWNQLKESLSNSNINNKQIEFIEYEYPNDLVSFLKEGVEEFPTIKISKNNNSYEYKGDTTFDSIKKELLDDNLITQSGGFNNIQTKTHKNKFEDKMKEKYLKYKKKYQELKNDN